MTDDAASTSPAQSQFPCGACGALVVYQPGTTALVCPYCGHANAIAAVDASVDEEDFAATLAGLASHEEMEEHITVKCSTCAAESTLPPNVSAGDCPFCGTPIVSTGSSTRHIKPRALLPFRITHIDARDAFRKWIDSLWFAPNALKKLARADNKVAGVYLPHWTYDCRTVSSYTGERGEHYYVNVSYRDSQGRSRTRRERRTRWYSASGTVRNAFDDVLVVASRSLPRDLASALEPWDLGELVPYQDDYLSGFRAETYQVDLQQGFVDAKAIMDVTIRATICSDIGGDEQRIHSVDTRHSDISFKHILLPVWLSAYRYHDKAYRFMVNARTGEVQGERPWSWIKITLAVLAGALLAAFLGLGIASLEGQ